jgi:hypothetical protein
LLLYVNDCSIAVGVENPHKFWMCHSLSTLDKLVDRFPLPPISPPIGDTSFTHVTRLAAHSTTPPTPTAMGQSNANILLEPKYFSKSDHLVDNEKKNVLA